MELTNGAILALVQAPAVEVRDTNALAETLYSKPAATVTQTNAVAEALFNKPAGEVEAAGMAVLDTRKTAANEGKVFGTHYTLLALTLSRPDDRRLRAWTFTLDGHDFYVLKLGRHGTIVFDTITNKWSEWKSEGFPYWRAVVGFNWGPDIVAGDSNLGMIWTIDNEPTDDSGVVITRVITTMLSMRLREAMPINGLMVAGAVGFGNSDLPVTMTLRTSDDNGRTWDDHGTEVHEGDNFRDELSWRSLGTVHAPGRIFQITDTGVATRIDGVDYW